MNYVYIALRGARLEFGGKDYYEFYDNQVRFTQDMIIVSIGQHNYCVGEKEVCSFILRTKCDANSSIYVLIRALQCIQGALS